MEDIETDLEKLKKDAATVEEFRQDLEELEGEKLPGLFAFSAILKNKQNSTETMYVTLGTAALAGPTDTPCTPARHHRHRPTTPPPPHQPPHTRYEETVDLAQDTLRSFGEDFEDVDVRLGIWLTRLLCLVTTLGLADEENHMADLKQARKEKAELAKKRKEEADAKHGKAKGGDGQGQGEAGAPQSLGLMDSLLQQAKIRGRGAANAGANTDTYYDTGTTEAPSMGMSMHELAKHKSMKLRAANAGDGDSDDSESSDSDGDWEAE